MVHFICVVIANGQCAKEVYHITGESLSPLSLKAIAFALQKIRRCKHFHYGCDNSDAVFLRLHLAPSCTRGSLFIFNAEEY